MTLLHQAAQKAVELRPCPFCGGEARCVDLAGWEIHCDCGAQLWRARPDKEALIEHWNTRVSLQQPEQATEPAWGITPATLNRHVSPGIPLGHEMNRLRQYDAATLQQQPEPVANENDAFDEWWASSGQGACPSHTLTTENCARATWHERARRAAPPAFQHQEVPREPVAWIRWCSDGGYEGPIMNHSMEEVRKRSGAWSPLYASPSTTRQQEVGSIPPAKLVNGQWEGVPLSQFPELQEQVRKGLADGSIQIGCGDASVEWTPEDEKRLDDALAKRADTRAAAPSTPEKAGGVSDGVGALGEGQQ